MLGALSAIFGLIIIIAFCFTPYLCQLSSEKLIKKFREGEFSQKEQVFYASVLVSYVVFISSTSLYALRARVYSEGLQAKYFFGDFLSLIFIIAIIIRCYLINKAGDDKDLLLRFMAFTVPIVPHYFFINTGLRYLPGLLPQYLNNDLYYFFSYGLLYYCVYILYSDAFRAIHKDKLGN
ncbi:MAG: hypothetical protein KDI90_11505 [Alphaproteobacteria bacterium]|nr:hypothetical protein [Alphaproteobacteria bacterium]MCB9974441.1 hypothetical protein [Rhodospirillales bacterium]